jgi:hypothetical protein
MPLTANGKLDRAALPAPEGDSLITKEYEAPVGDVEITIAEIWQELLGVDRVGRHDHFFELGGHSLTAITMIEMLRDKKCYVDVKAIFSTPTLINLAETIGKNQLELEASVVPANILDRIDILEDDGDEIEEFRI